MKLLNLNIELTDFDKILFGKNNSNSRFMNFVYADQQMIKINDYDEESETFTGEYDYISMLGFETTKCEGIPKDINIILPTNYSTFISYKSELKSVDFLIEGDLNISDPMVEKIVKKLTPEDYKNITHVIYEPLTLTGCCYQENEEHKFKSFEGSVVFACDSFDLALKHAFEVAKEEKDYSSPETRDKLKLLDDYYNSPEGEASVQKFVKEIEEKNKRNTDFFNSEDFKILEKETIPHLIKENNVEGLFSEDYMYAQEGKNQLLAEEIFFDFVEAAFHCGEVKEDKEAMFTTEYVELKHLRVSRTHGQGTVHDITLLN